MHSSMIIDKVVTHAPLRMGVLLRTCNIDEVFFVTCNIEGTQFVIQLVCLLLTKKWRQLKTKRKKQFYFRNPNLFSPLEVRVESGT